MLAAITFHRVSFYQSLICRRAQSLRPRLYSWVALRLMPLVIRIGSYTLNRILRMMALYFMKESAILLIVACHFADIIEPACDRLDAYS